ncbi:MAG: aldolase [Dehalococcoidia bacterium]|nr:aldolase [Dehalococcoidia bacterium]
MLVAEFQSVGQDLFLRGAVSSHGGNLSIRRGDQLIITRRGAHLGHLTDQDIIETGVELNDRSTPSASSELAVHRAIYRSTAAHAVVHAHPIAAMALSLLEDVLEPIDAEGRRLLKQVPVIGSSVIEATREVAEEVAAALGEHPAVLVRGHGSFTVGQLLDEAHRWTSVLEQSAQLIIAVRQLRR